jgi:hypothetical protein
MGRAKTAAELVAEAERLVAVVRRGNILPEDRAAIVNAVVVDMGAAYDQAVREPHMPPPHKCDKELATELYDELKEVMKGVPAQIDLESANEVRLKIICDSLAAAIHALKQRP